MTKTLSSDLIPQWIGIRRPASSDPSPASCLRKEFRIDGEVRSASMEWTALGVATVEINGCRIDDGFLSPGWSDYRSRVQLIRCDVSAFLRLGANVIGVTLADGWYAGALLWQSERCHYGESPQFCAMLRINIGEEQDILIPTDENWRVHESAITSADIYHGETYDARLAVPGWSSPGFNDSSWSQAEVFSAYRGIKQPKRCGIIRCTEQLRPVSFSVSSDGAGWICDFGQNFAGVCRLVVRNQPRGNKITLRFAEMLQDDGSLYLENLRTARATDVYICNGDRCEEWTPQFTFHGFRYARIDGLVGSPDMTTLTGLVLHTDLEPTGEFECSNADINQLMSNIRWGMRSNFLDVPTDCPQRDERLGWTGDAQVFVGTAALLYDVRTFFEKWMFDLVDGQQENGAFPDVAPDVLTAKVPDSFGNAAWGDAGIICPWVVYWHYGKLDILREHYDAMCRYMDFQNETSRDGLRPETRYGDWLAIDAVIPQHAPVPSDLIGTAYFARTAEIMEQIASLLNHPEDTSRFQRMKQKAREAFRREFVTESGRVVGDCQTAYLVALAFDLVPEKLVEPAVERLVTLIHQRNDHLSTGFVGTPLLCPVLTKFGHSDLAYKLLLQDDYPSWLYPIRNGATTIWERWNSYTKTDGFGPVGMNSFNHYAYGAVGEWIFSTVGGIQAAAPGYSEIRIAPVPGGGITSASSSLRSPRGIIRCSWTIGSDNLELDIEIPPGSPATLQLPPNCAPSYPAQLSPGHHTFKVGWCAKLPI